MATRIVTCTIHTPNGQPWPGFAVQYTVSPSQHTDTSHFPSRAVNVLTDNNGVAAATLATGIQYRVALGESAPFTVTITPGSEPLALESLRGAP